MTLPMTILPAADGRSVRIEIDGSEPFELDDARPTRPG